MGYSQIFEPDYANAFLNWTQLRYGLSFDKNHLVNAHGIVPALFELIKLLCKPDEKVLIMTPSYGFFKHAADGNNIELVSSDLLCDNGYYTMDFNDLENKAKDEKVTLCLFCNPHNPTGRVWDEQELKQFAQICLDNNVTIVSDEVHCDLLRKEQAFTPLAKLYPGKNIITCMSPSKTFNLAGLMFANLIIPNDNLRRMWIENNFPIVNPLSLAGAQAAYSNGHCWLQALTEYLDDNFKFLNSYLSENLPKAIYQQPESTYLAWVNLSAYFDKEENLTEFFAQTAGVLLEGGDMFVGNADGCIRLNLACPRVKLKEGLMRILKAINNHV
ncbi:MAG: aminotransferase class I/II-fold pyridoxal phosphate-dependent enzyme [Proteobacteria bacterium]|nr:aminotransferase class I/II-fold pyridoxal phosphate-dependent enzyme [Pseudomonadota bacterium]